MFINTKLCTEGSQNKLQLTFAQMCFVLIRMLRDDSECILGSWDAMNEDIGLFFCQRKNIMGSIEGDAKHYNSSST